MKKLSYFCRQNQFLPIEMAKEIKKKKDGKKDMVEKAVLRNVPEISYIKQPYNLTFMRGELSNMQLSAIIEVMDNMQDRVNQWLGMSYDNRNLQPTLFTEQEMQEGIPPIRIPISSLGVLPQYYDRLEEAVRSMTSQSIEYESEKDGIPVKVFAPLFKSIAIPRRSVLSKEKALDGKTEQPNKHTPRRGSFIEINLNTEVVPYLFDMRRYNKYIKEVARNCSLYTSRIYMCITAKKINQNRVWEISYPEFRQIMGADKYDSVKREWVTQKYPVYTDFRKRVLNGAMKELMELKEKGEVDCYFTYEEVFPGGIRRGNPDRLRFNIHITEMGMLEQEKNDITRDKYEVQDYLRQNFRFNINECRSFLRMVPEDKLGEMLKKAKSLKQYLDEHLDKIENAKGYAIQALKSWISEQIPLADEVSETKEFAENQEDRVENEPKKSSEISISENDVNLWSKFLKILEGYVDKSIYDTFMKYLELGSYQDNNLTINTPSRYIEEVIESQFSAPFLKAMAEVYGEPLPTIYFNVIDKK